MAEIRFVKADSLKEKPDVSKIGFGTHFTDYMFEMDYTEKDGWHDARIIPYGDIAVSPANTTLHYGQAVFEGLKAYRQGKRAVIFRPKTHLERMENSCRLLDIPEFPLETVHEGLKQRVALEKDWIPKEKGQSLYIRPFIFADDPYLGVSVSGSYKLLIILSPVAAYYAHGFAPVKIMVEIEEVGSMNILFKIGGKVVTPELDGSILNGVTRRTVLAVAKEWGVPTEERKISVDEIIDGYKSGALEEVFGSGTAAVISPVGVLGYKNHDMVIGGGKIGPFAQKMYDYIEGLHIGEVEDKYGFIETVAEY